MMAESVAFRVFDSDYIWKKTQELNEAGVVAAAATSHERERD